MSEDLDISQTLKEYEKRKTAEKKDKHITERVAEGNTLQKEWQRETHYRKSSRRKHIIERVAEGNTIQKE